jgi:TusA-related sulfurtransferase
VTKKILVSLVVALTLVFLTGWAAYACGNHGEKDCCPIGVKGAKVEATNIANGITVTITSDDPEVVKQIQEETANCKCEGKKKAKCEVTNVANGVTILITSDDPKVVKKIQEHQANCLKNCPKECCGSHKSGKCPGHMWGYKHKHK